MATVRVLRPPYIYTPWPRFLMMMVQTESCWLTATSKLLAVKCPYHQHVQNFLEIVLLWRGRDLIPGRGNTGWPSSARWYAINTSILIQSLRARIPEVKQVWLADDSAGGGPTELLYNWYKLFCQEGKKCGYLVNGSKKIADSKARVVKTQDLADEAELVFKEGVRITTEGQRHLGVVIGSQKYKDVKDQ